MTEPYFQCMICRDAPSRMKLVEDGTWLGQPVYVAVQCDCQRQDLFRTRFEVVLKHTPEEYGFLQRGLESIKPDINRHPKQEKILEKIKSAPAESYLFYGLSGCGKSAVSWAMAQTAALTGKQVFCGTAELLILSFQTWMIKHEKLQKASLWSFDQLLDPKADKWFIMIDEIEKIKLSDYTLRTLFGIIKIAKEQGHQLVVTANRTLQEIEDRWMAIDTDGKLDAENYAAVIRRRLMEYCNTVDMRLFECAAGHHSAVENGNLKCLICGAAFQKWLR